MKKILTLLFTVLSLACFSQTGLIRNIQGSAPGFKRYVDTLKTLNVTSPLYKVNDTTMGIDTSKFSIQSFSKNTGRDSTILLMKDGTRYAVRDSIGAGAVAVDSIWRTLGQDSIKFSINGRLRSIKDSTGGGGGSPAGSDAYVQYNNSGSFGADSGFRYKRTGITSTLDNKTYLGMVLKPVIPQVGSGDTAVALDIQQIFSPGAFSNGTNISLRMRTPIKRNIFTVMDSTRILVGNIPLSTLSQGGSIMVDSFGLAIYKNSGNYMTMKINNGNFEIGGLNTGIYFKESGATKFSVTSTGVGYFSGALSATYVSAPGADFWSPSGSGTLATPNTVNLGDAGRIASGSGAFGLKFGCFSGSYQDRWWMFSNGNFANSATDNGSALQTTSFSAGYVAKTATYTASATDYTINCTANTFTVTLPTAVGIAGRQYVITNSGAGTITIGTTSSQTFTNVTATPTTLTLASLGAVIVQSTGANWLQIN